MFETKTKMFLFCFGYNISYKPFLVCGMNTRGKKNEKKKKITREKMRHSDKYKHTVDRQTGGKSQTNKRAGGDNKGVRVT